MIWFYFIFVSNLVLFLSNSTFFKLFFLNLNFLNLFFFICFFKFIPNYFGWLWVLHCYFFRFDFYIMIHSWSILQNFKGWIELASVIFHYFLKIHLSSLSSLEICILYLKKMDSFVSLNFFQFWPSIQDFCLSSQFFFILQMRSLFF